MFSARMPTSEKPGVFLISMLHRLTTCLPIDSPTGCSGEEDGEEVALNELGPDAGIGEDPRVEECHRKKPIISASTIATEIHTIALPWGFRDFSCIE